MTLAWFICSYKLRPNRPNFRYCAMDDFTPQITADGGTWAESEVLGGSAVVKVRASDTTLTTIAGTAGFQRIPGHVLLTDLLSDLTVGQRNALNIRLLAMGYTLAELQTALTADLRTVTLGRVLRFAASRRLKPRWDDVQLQIVLDGAFQACRPIAEVEAEVQ